MKKPWRVVLVILFILVAGLYLIDDEFYYSKEYIIQNEQTARSIINAINAINTLQGQADVNASFVTGVNYYYKEEKFVGIAVPSSPDYKAVKRVLKRWAKQEGLYDEQGQLYSGGDKVYMIAK